MKGPSDRGSVKVAVSLTETALALMTYMHLIDK